MMIEMTVRADEAARGAEDDVDPHEIVGEATVLPSGRDVFVLGKLRGRFGYGCGRCLEPFGIPVEIEAEVALR